VARQLLQQAPTPAAMSALTVAEIDQLIEKCAFHGRKAEQIHTIAQHTHTHFGDDLPCDREILLSLPGVGPKCANLVLGIVCGQPYIGVDIHVHRITNRWGYVQTNTPEQTLAALEQKLPPAYWVEINRLLVPFGKFICHGRAPRCTTCPLTTTCPRLGVTTSAKPS
jgi:endonuclease III